MISSKQLWLLTGGNGAGKSTFYRLFLAPRGINLVNADLIAKNINSENPEKESYNAAKIAVEILGNLLDEGTSFCYETVFSHISKIDLTARAKAKGYEIILVYIHLDSPGLNEARVKQRVTEGGHSVPAEKIHSRIPRVLKNISKILPVVDEARLLDNSSREKPFQQVAIVKKGKRKELLKPLPEWAKAILNEIP